MPWPPQLRIFLQPEDEDLRWRQGGPPEERAERLQLAPGAVEAVNKCMADLAPFDGRRAPATAAELLEVRRDLVAAVPSDGPYVAPQQARAVGCGFTLVALDTWKGVSTADAARGDADGRNSGRS